MSIHSKMTAIADAIREKTGGTNPLTLDAMAEAIAGIEAGGGSSGGASSIYMAKITPASDVSAFTITHNLGTMDILASLVWAESLGGVVPSVDQAVGNIWLKSDIPSRVTSSVNRENIESFFGFNATDGYISSTGLKNSLAYEGKPEDDNTFYVKAGTYSSSRFYGGVTYTVVIMAASAFKETEG